MPKGSNSIRAKVVLVEFYGYSHKSLVGALSLCELTLGKGTLRTYPSLRVPTHPFRVLGLNAHGRNLGELFMCK